MPEARCDDGGDEDDDAADDADDDDDDDDDDDGDVRCRSGRRVVVRGATVHFRQPPPIFESLTRQNEY